VSLIITKSHQVPRRKTKHGYILLTATQKKVYRVAGRNEKKTQTVRNLS
jgi:hypothetical protein